MTRKTAISPQIFAIGIARVCFDVVSGDFEKGRERVAFCPSLVWEEFSQHLSSSGWDNEVVRPNTLLEGFEAFPGVLYRLAPSDRWAAHSASHQPLSRDVITFYELQ